LDALRGVLGEAGAALGFVRLVRLGALRHGDDAAGSLPRAAPPPQLRDEAVRGALGEGAVAAAGALDGVLRGLPGGRGGRGADYFAALVNVFQEELRSDTNAHLREFWLLLPALCANHCEALLAAKERLGKRGREAATAGFADDGFAMGTAYLLRVLGQDDAFDSLRWHEAAERHYERLAAEAAAAAVGAKSRVGSGAADDAAVAADMRAVKAKALLSEARLLHWTIHGARTLMQ
jgi:WASH complex subunit 7